MSQIDAASIVANCYVNEPHDVIWNNKVPQTANDAKPNIAPPGTRKGCSRSPFSRRSRSRACSTTPARGCGRSASPSYRAVARGARVLAEAFGDSGERREPLGALSRSSSRRRVALYRAVASPRSIGHAVASRRIISRAIPNRECRHPSPARSRSFVVVRVPPLGLGGPAPDEPPHGELRRRR